MSRRACVMAISAAGSCEGSLGASVPVEARYASAGFLRSRSRISTKTADAISLLSKRSRWTCMARRGALDALGRALSEGRHCPTAALQELPRRTQARPREARLAPRRPEPREAPAAAAKRALWLLPFGFGWPAYRYQDDAIDSAGGTQVLQPSRL